MTSTLEYCVVYFVTDRILLKDPIHTILCHRENNEYFYWLGIAFAQMKVADEDTFPYLTVSEPGGNIYSAIPLDEARILGPPPPRELSEMFGNNGQIKRIHIEKGYGDGFAKYIYSLLTPAMVSAIYFEWENEYKISASYEGTNKLLAYFDSDAEDIPKIISITPTVVNSYAKTTFTRQTIIADVIYQFYKGSEQEKYIHRIYGMDFFANPPKSLKLAEQSRLYLVTKSSLIRTIVATYSLREMSDHDYIYCAIMGMLCVHACDIIHSSMNSESISISFCAANINPTIYGWPMTMYIRAPKPIGVIFQAYRFDNSFLKVEEEQMNDFINNYNPTILEKLTSFTYNLTTSLSDQKFYICEIIDLLIMLESLNAMMNNISTNPASSITRQLKKFLSYPIQHNKSPLLSILNKHYLKRLNEHVTNFVI